MTNDGFSDVDADFDRAALELLSAARVSPNSFVAPWPTFIKWIRQDVEWMIAGSLAHPTTIANRAPRVYLRFVDSPQVNGWAFEGDESSAFIAISIGSVAIVADLILRLLCRPDVLPDIGNATLEQTGRGGASSWTPQIGPATLLLDSLPLDVVRKHLGLDMLRMAMLFLASHELAHLRFGHLPYLRDHEVATLAVLSERDVTSVAPMRRQMIELSADHFAVAQSLNLSLRMKLQDEVSVSVAQRFRLWCFTTWCLFWVLSAAEVESGQIEQRLYPPVRQRQLAAIARAFDILQPRAAIPTFSQSAERIYDHVPDAESLHKNRGAVMTELLQIERGLQEITSQRPGRDYVAWAADIEGQQHFRRLLLEWQDLRGELEPYAWGRDLLPAMPAEFEAQVIARLTRAEKPARNSSA